MAVWLIVCPILAAGVAFAIPSNRWRPWVVPIGGALHLFLVTHTLQQPETPEAQSWLALDALGTVFLGYISVLFFLCACYAPAYLAQRQERNNRVLCSCLLLSLSMMTLVSVAQHLGLMWVGMEASTLVSAPGLYFNHNARSLEATWKYLLLCSVGIALALLGLFFLAYGALYAGMESSLLLNDLILEAPRLSRPWLHAAFVLLFVGYGTKMGLAPMHNWKPDAYGEAAGIVGALLAGGVTSCAFLSILRIYQITHAAGDALYAQRILVAMGLLSMVLAAISMQRQRDIKRLLAYSSVEHMGMLIFGIGIGGGAILGSLMHVIHNGLTKGVLFLAAGNIHRAYGSKFTEDLQGVLKRTPFSGWMFLAAFLAITGSPPFAPFVSEFQMLTSAFGTGHYWAGGLFVFALFVVFIGFGIKVIAFSFGEPSVNDTTTGFHDSIGTGLPILLFMALVVLLGVYRPPALHAQLQAAALLLGGRP